MSDASSVAIDVASRTNFFVRQLEIVPELLGATMDFFIHGCPVRVELPRAEEVDEDGILVDGDPVKPFAKATQGYRMGNTVAQYHVHRVDVVTFPTARPDVPEEALRLPPVQRELFSNAQRAALEGIAQAGDAISNHTLNTWVRVLRWKTLNGAICRPAVVGPYRERTYLTERATGHRFWCTTATCVVQATRSVTVQQWENATSSLQLGELPPIWFDLVFDASEHLALGDLNRTVVDLAVACEVCMKHRTMTSMPHGLSASAKRYLDRAPVRNRGFKMFEEALPHVSATQFLPFRRSLDALFDARNEVVHAGSSATLVEADCQNYLAAALALIALP